RPVCPGGTLAMRIRPFQPGDEAAQAAIYNAVVQQLPAFKPATADEIIRRYQASDADPTARFYAEADDGRVVAYAVFNPTGRISFPWCLPGHEAEAQPALLEVVLAGLKARGIPRAWAAYRADWQPVGQFFREHGFAAERSMINFVALVA